MKRNNKFNALEANHVMQFGSLNGVISWKRYVSIKSQQVNLKHRLRLSAGMRVTILPPVVNCQNMVIKILLKLIC